tara:strand:+ start:5641 stop:6288 length:648 start_codon:yes stop_codon:yes gene_type:complete
MVKQNINIVGIPILYNILKEIKDNLAFNVVNFAKEDDFLNFLGESQKENNYLFIITTINKKDFFFKKTKVESKNIFFLSQKNNKIELNNNYNILKYPIDIYYLIEKINIQLIKHKYSFQSEVKLKNYSLDLNSRLISKDNKTLRLTEKEMEIILFLNNSKTPQKINSLQNEVWSYSSDLETHTVETHIYRLRKKISNSFKDNNFIISTDGGYSIK